MQTKKEGPVVFSGLEKYAGIINAVKIGGAAVLKEVKASNLRGRGGAGFPTGIKWDLAASALSDKKYVVCNADEGEPGTFKDRVVLTEYPALIFEGMAIAAFASGADKGILYLRGEYMSFVPALKQAIEKMKADNILGRNIIGVDGFNFDIEIKLGSGSYVCGEETGLIESLEGNRAEPRNRPPFPVNTGYNGCPTVLNNVETFINIPHIIAKGSGWFKSFGTNRSAGTKLISISGDCKRPGVYEVEFGTTIKELLKLAGAEQTKAVSAGASGECVPKAHFDRKIAFENFSTGGSVIVFSRKRSMLDAEENFLRFFEDESCGQCTPCREGTPVLIEGLDMIRTGRCSKDYMDDLLSLAETMQIASKCGLGQTCPRQFISMVKDFKSEYKLSKRTERGEAFNG